MTCTNCLCTGEAIRLSQEESHVRILDETLHVSLPEGGGNAERSYTPTYTHDTLHMLCIYGLKRGKKWFLIYFDTYSGKCLSLWLSIKTVLLLSTHTYTLSRWAAHNTQVKKATLLESQEEELILIAMAVTKRIKGVATRITVAPWERSTVQLSPHSCFTPHLQLSLRNCCRCFCCINLSYPPREAIKGNHPKRTTESKELT